jgi:hypothetical protein
MGGRGLQVSHLKGRLLGGPRQRSEDNIIMNLRDIGLEFVHCIHVTQHTNQ